MAGLVETITVSGATPLVDVTSTTSRTQLTRETLEIIPTGRAGIQSVMVQAPGVRTNLDYGNPNGNPAFRVFGQDNESWTVVEGVADHVAEFQFRWQRQFFRLCVDGRVDGVDRGE